MKKLFAILTAITSIGMLPSVSQASCNQVGEIVRVSVSPLILVLGSSFIDLRQSAPNSITYRFATSDVKVIEAITSAAASHMQVAIFGGGAGLLGGPCGAVVGGLSAGGLIESITLAP